MPITPITIGQLRSERKALAQAITLLESNNPEHRSAAEALLLEAMPHTGEALRLTVSGPPGVGKSTFIEAAGLHAVHAGRRVAVLAIDPSSVSGGGSILGDKTRMARLAAEERAFVRPSPSGGLLGGVAPGTGEAMLLCEAAGFDCVVIETVGVGQSEVQAAQLCDIFLLMLPPAGGDELQGIKRGIMELADIVLVNKADGDLETAAAQMQAQVQSALSLLPGPLPGWRVPVLKCSALHDLGLEEVRQAIADCHDLLKDSGHLAERRRERACDWLLAETRHQLLAALTETQAVAEQLQAMQNAVADGELPASLAARRIIEQFLA